MPHFSGWSWPKPFIGTLDQALSKIEIIEEETKWEDKIDKAVWRGTGQFNSVGNIALRPQLLEVTKGKSWADVELLQWGNNAVDAKNAIGIEDFCKYKYIIYTEVRILPSMSPLFTMTDSHSFRESVCIFRFSLSRLVVEIASFKGMFCFKECL
jgi:hypothetical protein